jgi:glycerophosphoryl diester phosphodiesterase
LADAFHKFFESDCERVGSRAGRVVFLANAVERGFADAQGRGGVLQFRRASLRSGNIDSPWSSRRENRTQLLHGRNWFGLHGMFTAKRFVVVLLSLLLQQSSVFAVEIIAHRGASADAPENTLASMKLAWEQNADAVELDLWLSKDGKLIVFHDSDTKRFETMPRKISSLTLDEARHIDVGLWKSAQFKGESIPTLESILATIPKGRRAVLEIKCGPEIVPELSRVIHESGRAPEQLVIISFNYDSLVASKKAWPKIDHHFLMDYKKEAKTDSFPELKPLIARAKAGGFDGLNLQFKWPITKSFVSEVKAAGLKMLVWTVDDAAVAQRLADAGVDAITTNKPKRLREQLK